MAKQATEKKLTAKQLTDAIVNRSKTATEPAAMNGEHERVKTLLHDRNRDLNEIFAARKAVKEAKYKIGQLNADVKAAKEELKEAEAHLQKVIDAQLSGERNLFKEENGNPEKKQAEQPKTLPQMTERGAEPKPPTEEKKTSEFASEPTKGEIVIVKTEIGESIDVLKGISKGRLESIRKQGINTVPELEAAIGKGDVQTWKGFGESAVSKVEDAILEYRKEHPKEKDAAADIKPVQGTLKAELDEALEGVEFESLDGEIDPDDDLLIGGDVELLNGDEDDLAPPEDSDEGPQDDPEDLQIENVSETVPTNQTNGEVDPGELGDILAGVFVFVPGEIILGWNKKIRQAVKVWALEVSDAADNRGDAPAAYPRQIERFLKKNQLSDPVAFVKSRRG